MQNVLADQRLVSNQEITLIHAVEVPSPGLTLPERVAHQVRAAVAAGLLAPGARLPRESLIADSLAISPMSWRQSLTLLRETGTIVTTRGNRGGSFIADDPSLSMNFSMSRLAGMSGFELDDLTHLTASALSTASERAASRYEESDDWFFGPQIEALRAVEGPIELRRASILFHLKLATIACSPRLTSLTTNLLTEFNLIRWTDGLDSEPEVLFALDVVDDLRSGSVADAKDRVHQHILQAGERINAARIEGIRGHANG